MFCDRLEAKVMISNGVMMYITGMSGYIAGEPVDTLGVFNDIIHQIKILNNCYSFLDKEDGFYKIIMTRADNALGFEFELEQIKSMSEILDLIEG